MNETIQNPDEARSIRAYSILAKGDTPCKVDEEHFLVPSQSSGKKYKITHLEGWDCDCPDFQNRKLPCKHIKAVQFWLKLRNKIELEDIDMEQELNKEICPHCKGEKLKKDGLRKNKEGVKQRYKCMSCNKRFVLTPIKYIKGTAKHVCLVMDLYFKGLSLRDIKDTFKQFYGMELSHETIRLWIQKFSGLIEKYTETLKPEFSDKFHVDEQKCRDKHGDWQWVWNCIDSETRYLIANNVTRGRTLPDAEEIFDKVKQKTGKERDLTIVTDKLPSYPHAIAHAFWKGQDWEHNMSIKHWGLAGIAKEDMNNNKVERFHGQFREFDKVRRGIENLEEYSTGFKVFHNFVRTEFDGKTPSERAGINLDLGQNKWMGLLKKSLEA